MKFPFFWMYAYPFNINMVLFQDYTSNTNLGRAILRYI